MVIRGKRRVLYASFNLFLIKRKSSTFSIHFILLRVITAVVIVILKVKFDVHRVDNMVIQSIALLDQLDKDINLFGMRIREW